MTHDTRVRSKRAERASDTRSTGLHYFKGLPSDLAAVARWAQMPSAFRIPVHRAVGTRAMDAVLAEGGSVVPERFLNLSQPRLVILADAKGPGGWLQAGELTAWCAAAVFLATAGDASHYALVSVATVLHQRVLLIETEPRHLDAWMRLAERVQPGLNLLNIVPENGGHPPRGAPAGASVH